MVGSTTCNARWRTPLPIYTCSPPCTYYQPNRWPSIRHTGALNAFTRHGDVDENAGGLILPFISQGSFFFRAPGTRWSGVTQPRHTYTGRPVRLFPSRASSSVSLSVFKEASRGVRAGMHETRDGTTKESSVPRRRGRGRPARGLLSSPSRR